MPYDFLFATAPHLKTRWRKPYVQRLTQWFATEQRDLPWRATHDPYAIWLSESMLQQTQVATVIDYYHRFLSRFPTVETLALAGEADVLTQWAGLGYYRRARQLHATAKQIVDEHAGKFPSDVPSLMKLPGVGRYTAGAIASIAFDKPAPIVEANTERLFARLIGWTQPLRTKIADQVLWQFAEFQLPQRDGAGSRNINQAAMELGSLICKPVRPLCLVCPIAALCITAQDGLQATIPAAKPKKVFTTLHHVAIVIERNGRWLVRKNPVGAWWTGLWDFPRVDITQHALPPLSAKPSVSAQSVVSDRLHQSVAQAAQTQLGLNVSDAKPLFHIAHSVTRYRIRLDCVTAELADSLTLAMGLDMPATARHVPHENATSSVVPSEFRWSSLTELEQLPLTAPARKILQRLSQS